MHPFESLISISFEEIEFSLRSCGDVPWSPFVLNPRRLRGSDFLMRWSQGVWSEKRLMEAVNKSGKHFAVPYGPSGTAPANDVRAFELYFERLENAGLGNIKRPDLLIFKKSDNKAIKQFLNEIGGVQELPFLAEAKLKPLLDKAIVAIECETSLWKSKRMPDYKTEFSAQKRLGGKLGLRKNAVLPTIIIKEEDMAPLIRWQTQNHIPIHIWHVFYDQAFGIALSSAARLVKRGLIEPTIQVFQAPGGATTKKVIYKIYYHYGYQVGISSKDPTLISAHIEDKNGHILPYVKFDGGNLVLCAEVLQILQSL